MKICILTHSFPRNSNDVSAAFMKEFCDGLVLAGNEIVVVTPFDKEFYRTNDLFKIVTYKYIWPDSLHILGYSRTMVADVRLKKRMYLLLPFMIFFGSLSLIKTIKREHIELISVHWILPNGLIALIACWLTKVPYVVTLPGTDTFLATKNSLFSSITKLIANHSKGIFSNSSWHLKKIISLGIKEKYTQVITYPVDTNKFKPIKDRISEYKKRLGVETNLVLLAVGRLVYKKGFIYLIQAMPEILKINKNIKLLIGGDGDLRQQLETKVRELDILESVLFLGTLKRDEVVYYYNLADIMITPSIIDNHGNVDGRPLVILESMACGKPQIVTDLPGISDSLEEGVNALIVPQKDPFSIADAVIKLVKSEALRDRMGKLNRKKAVNSLSTKKIGRQYTEAFNEILNN